MAKLTCTCLEFKPLVRNTLRGFACIKIEEMQMEIKDITVHEKNGKRWAALPSKPQIRDRAVLVGDDDKILYAPVMAFTSRAVADAFSATVVKAVLQLFPDAFDVERVP